MYRAGDLIKAKCRVMLGRISASAPLMSLCKALSYLAPLPVEKIIWSSHQLRLMAR